MPNMGRNPAGARGALPGDVADPSPTIAPTSASSSPAAAGSAAHALHSAPHSHGPVSPAQAPPETLREQEKERQQLLKSNFNLKLRVFYLEERLAKFKRGTRGGVPGVRSFLFSFCFVLQWM